MEIISVGYFCPNSKIAIAIARFNDFINKNLLNGALDILTRLGQIKDENITIVWLPGSYELPMVVNELVKKNKFDAIIALGTIIKGTTNHFTHVSNTANSGLSNVILNSEIPISFGILTTNNVEQAIERSGIKENNYGSKAAMTVLEMINLIKYIKKY